MGYYTRVERTDFKVAPADLDRFYTHMTGNKVDLSRDVCSELMDLAGEEGLELYMGGREVKVYKVYDGDVLVDTISKRQIGISGFQGGSGRHDTIEEFLLKLSQFDPDQMIACEQIGEDDDRWVTFAYQGKIENVYPNISYVNPFTEEIYKVR